MSATLDDLFNSDITELADLPVFKSRPAGSYLTQFSYERVEEDDKKYIKFTFAILEVLELKDESRREEIKFDGDKKPSFVFTAFPFKKDKDSGDLAPNAFGEGLIKLIAMGLKEINPGANVGEILDNNQNAQVAITVKETKKKDKETGEVKEQNELVTLSGV